MKKILLIILAIVMGGLIIKTPVFASTCGKDADGNPIETIVIDCEGKGGEDAVYSILIQVMDIMSVGIGIIGVIGVGIVGTQYLTAGGNEEKTRKAKRRMLEIVIGLVVYVLIYTVLKWLIPSFSVPSPK